MVGVPSSCALLGWFAIGARVSLLWQHTRTSNVSECLYSLCVWFNVCISIGVRWYSIRRCAVCKTRKVWMRFLVQTGIRGIIWWAPLPSNRHHQSNGVCLEGKRENYQVCSVQYCVQQLCTVQCTHIWTDLTGLWIGFCLTGPISLCLDSFLCMYVNVCIFCMTVYCMNV